MTEKLIFWVLNTSAVVGICIALLGVLLSFGRKRYSAGCRKAIWILIALCLLVPFHLISFSGAYTAQFPILVLWEFDGPAANAKGDSAIHSGIEQSVRDQAAQGREMQGQAVQDREIQSQAEQGQFIERASRIEITTADILFALWACVGILLAVYYTAGYWRMKGKIRRWSSSCEDCAVMEMLSETAAQCGLKRIPEVRIMQGSATGPFTTGVLKNVIILPDDDISEKDLRFILKHEVVHCRNRDIVWKLLFLTVNIIHWFNPLVWLMRRAAEQDMEIACDEAVVRSASREDRKEYSDVILSWVERSRSRGSAVSTGYVRGVRFLKRRFDNIFSGGKKKGVLPVCGACVLVLLIGFFISVRGGSRIYAMRDIPIDYGIEVRTDIDGDGQTDRVRVYDTAREDYGNTQVTATLSDGSDFFIDYPDSWAASYLITGDLSGNGAADVVVVREYIGSTYGGCEVSVLHMGQDDLGENGWEEYSGRLIPNQELEIKWIDWDNYTGDYIPDADYDLRQPEGFGPAYADFACIGAAVIVKDGKTMLRLVSLIEAQEEIVKCIDCSWREDGWFIEDMQILYNYSGGGWKDKLLGLTFSPAMGGSAPAQSGEIRDYAKDSGTSPLLPEDFWSVAETDGDRSVRFATGLEIIFPEEWQGKTVFETYGWPEDDPHEMMLLVCEKGNLEAGIGGELFYLSLYENTDNMFTINDYNEVLGFYTQGGREYVLVRDTPGDRQYSEEDDALIDAYLRLSETIDKVIINTDNMTGFKEMKIQYY